MTCKVKTVKQFVRILSEKEGGPCLAFEEHMRRILFDIDKKAAALKLFLQRDDAIKEIINIRSIFKKTFHVTRASAIRRLEEVFPRGSSGLHHIHLYIQQSIDSHISQILGTTSFSQEENDVQKVLENELWLWYIAAIEKLWKFYTLSQDQEYLFLLLKEHTDTERHKSSVLKI